MPTFIGGGVSHDNILHEEWQYPWNLNAAIVAGDVGKAVALDTAAARTVKLAGDNDIVIGRLETVELRSVEGLAVGTVSMKGALRFPYPASGVTFAVGDLIVGSSTAGHVKPLVLAVQAAGAAGYAVRPYQRVTAVDTVNKTIEVLAL